MARLGWLGPTIVVVGAAVAGVGAWFIVHARPEPGKIVDTIAVDNDTSIVIRDQAGGDRSFIELHSGSAMVWQAYIPHYAGRPGAPGVAYSPVAVSVRVERDGHAEVFGLSTNDASKLGGFTLAVEHEPITTQPTGPVTLSDHIRSYEVVGGADWHQLIAVDLTTGKGVWKDDLGPAPIETGAVADGVVTITQGGKTRAFDAASGDLKQLK
jgi:outer membrane protein assembly factor BamB